jgi:hypothetical protein
MQTLQGQLSKYRNFVSQVRLTKQEKTMQTNNTNQVSRSTGGQAANKRYKRTSEELDRDIARVDELVASGKFNQIEALHQVGLQSSVYHQRKRIANEAVAKSIKPRKFAHRNRTPKEVAYEQKKQEVLKQLETKSPAPVVEQKPVEASSNKEMELAKELANLKAKYAKLAQYVAERAVNEHK